MLGGHQESDRHRSNFSPLFLEQKAKRNKKSLFRIALSMDHHNANDYDKGTLDRGLVCVRNMLGSIATDVTVKQQTTINKPREIVDL